MDSILSSAAVSMPPVPQAGSRMLMTRPGSLIVSSSGAIRRLPISSMPSRGLGVVIWRGWMLRWNNVVPPPITSRLAECRTPDDVKNLRRLCEQNPSPLARLILLAANHLDWPKADNVDSLETAARHEIVRLERGLVVLEIIVGIAPLLGLVGTIIGMITVFGAIVQPGLNDASKLASGISYILWTTLI